MYILRHHATKEQATQPSIEY